MSLHDFQRLQEKLAAVNDPVSFLVNLFAHAPVGFAVWTVDGYPLLTNKAFLDLFGSEPPPEYNVFKDDLLEKSGLLEYFTRAFKGEIVHVPTFWYDPRDLQSIKVTEGKRVAISMTVFPLLKSNGEMEYVGATYKDETAIATLNASLEQMVHDRTIQLNAVNRELEAFSYSVAHDLRSPLRNMNGIAAALLEDHRDSLDDKALELLQQIQDNAITMSQLIDALLDLAKVTRNDLKFTQVDISALAKLVTAQLTATEPERVVDVVIQDNMQARMDSSLASALLENLIANAWKFTCRTQAAHIEVGTEKINGEQVFFVRDNGTGFDPNRAKELFKPFRRLHSTQDFPGTGIGLATVYRIIDRHGGRIWSESTLGEGATFYFTLSAT